jgi:DNA-binding transcriptional ArsR family regulator
MSHTQSSPAARTFRMRIRVGSANPLKRESRSATAGARQRGRVTARTIRMMPLNMAIRMQLASELQRRLMFASPRPADLASMPRSSFAEHRRVPVIRASHLRFRRRGKAAPRADVELAGFAKALGHPMRARIVRLLAGRDRCMYGSIAEMLPLAPSTVSQHLQVLQAAGLVHGEARGPRVCYCIDRGVLARGRALLANLCHHSM